MVKLGTHSTQRTKTVAPKASAKPAGNNSSSGIKKAISTSKPNEETESSKTDAEETLEQDQLEEGIDSSTRQETETEKKKNLDKLLKRGLTKKETPDAKDKKTIDKENNKETNKEWENNSNAKEKEPQDKEGKRTDILTDKDRLKDVLKHDKDTIAKRYPGIERPGAQAGSPQESPKQQGNSASNNQGNSGSSNNNNGNGSGTNNSSGDGSQISKLSNGTGNSNGGSNIQNNGNHSHNHSHEGINNRPGPNNGGNIDIPRGNDNRGSVHDHGDSHNNHPVAHTKFESLFTEGHLEGKTIQANSAADAERITSTLRDVGAFDKIEQDGNSIKLSGFNADKSHDIHEAHGQILGREFLDGNIGSFSFEGVNEDIAGNLTEMLEAKASEIGSENHSIGQSCNDGVCEVTVENNQTNQPEPQETQDNVENNEEQYA